MSFSPDKTVLQVFDPASRICRISQKADEIRVAPPDFTGFFIYANNEPKSALARDLGDCRDNKGKLAKRVFTCLQEIPMELTVKKMDTNGTQNTYSKIVRQEIGL